MFDLTNIQPQVSNLINAPNLIINPTNTSIVFDKVKFQYTEGRELFSDLSFEVPAGKKLKLINYF